MRNNQYREEYQYESAAMPMDPYHASTVAQAAASERAIFIRNTYVHVVGALVAFALLTGAMLNFVPPETMARIFGKMGMAAPIILTIGFLGISYLAHYWAQSHRSKTVQYLGLGIYIVALAFVMWPLLFIASRIAPGVITNAAIMTGALAIGITVATFISQRDFSFVGKYLCIGCFVLLGIGIAAAIFGFNLGLWFSVAYIVLLAVSIAKETSMVMYHYHTGEHVAASLSIFSSVAIMFYYFVRLLLDLSSD